MLQQAEPDEPGSIQYNYQVWRQQRNEQINVETQSQAVVAGTCALYPEPNPRADAERTEDRRWDRPVATFQTSGYPLTMAFHSYDQHLVVANESDMIRSGLTLNLIFIFLNSSQRLGLVTKEAPNLLL